MAQRMFGRIRHPQNLFNHPVAESTVKTKYDLLALEPETAQPPILTLNASASTPETKTP
jgi:hypothetical protein